MPLQFGNLLNFEKWKVKGLLGWFDIVDECDISDTNVS